MIELILPSWLAGMLITMVSGPLGSFVIWRRMSYFGDTLSHASLLGVALGFLLYITPFYTVLSLTLLLAIALNWLESKKQLPIDTLLGILAHSALSLGLVVISLMDNIRIDLMGYLFGDLLAITYQDVIQIGIGVIFISIILLYKWSSFLFITISEELAFV
ncbi:MAG: metal ABC transporter permease, partial [Candidatus Schmidhempelia sp.]|nr:metal ABC transporter permease [Candidatus Schmidhempelia sp.]